jgi:hypothetical protein
MCPLCFSPPLGGPFFELKKKGGETKNGALFEKNGENKHVCSPHSMFSATRVTNKIVAENILVLFKKKEMSQTRS